MATLSLNSAANPGWPIKCDKGHRNTYRVLCCIRYLPRYLHRGTAFLYGTVRCFRHSLIPKLSGTYNTNPVLTTVVALSFFLLRPSILQKDSTPRGSYQVLYQSDEDAQSLHIIIIIIIIIIIKRYSLADFPTTKLTRWTYTISYQHRPIYPHSPRH